MKNNPNPSPNDSNPSPGRWRLILGAGALVGLFVLLRPQIARQTMQGVVTESAKRPAGALAPPAPRRAPLVPGIINSETALSAEEIVAGKLAQFARSRREFAHALARRHNVTVSDEVERFFAAVESGDWDEIEASFNVINGGDSSAGHNRARPAGLEHLWPAVIDAYGVAEQVHDWPAQQLLDYGNAVLSSLRPGMVYVGGTDNGRWIPELLNDTSEGERHIIITQNGLADAAYLDYVNLQYGDQLATLSPADGARIFAEYSQDAARRLAHDQEHPDEPKQLRPGEQIAVTADGRISISGQVAVMAINEKLLQTLLATNPDRSFALQESFPLNGTYSEAQPLGPLMELRAQDGQESFTAERATQSLDYWRNTAQQVLADPDTGGSTTALKSYSHDAVSAANLLAAHHFTAQAEEAYRLARQLWPANPESVGHLADLLTQHGRETEARQMLDEFTRDYPDQRKELERFSTATTLIGPANPPAP